MESKRLRIVCKMKWLRSTKCIWFILQFLSFFLMLAMASKLEVEYSWDWGRLIHNASEYVLQGDFDKTYFARYPNNQFWFLCLTGLFRMIKLVFPAAQEAAFKVASVAFSCILTQAAIALIYQTACDIWGEKKGFCVGIASLTCLPFYLYAQFAYTDTPGVFLAALVLFLWHRMQKSAGCRQTGYAAAIGITAAIAGKVKIMLLIFVIALLMAEVWEKRGKIFCRRIWVLLVSFGFTFALISSMVSHSFAISGDMYDRNEIPAEHWIMMALGETGGYLPEDEAYTMSFPTYRQKQEADRKQIQERLSQYGVLGTVKHIFVTKLIRTWGNSCLNGDDYVGRSPVHGDNGWQKLFAKGGRWHGICLVYSWVWHLLMLLGVGLSIFSMFRRKGRGGKVLMEQIAIGGVFLFLSIWECNSRYLLVFLPALILAACEGWLGLLAYGKIGE